MIVTVCVISKLQRMDLRKEAGHGVPRLQAPTSPADADAHEGGLEKKGGFSGIILERCLKWFNTF